MFSIGFTTFPTFPLEILLSRPPSGDLEIIVSHWFYKGFRFKTPLGGLENHRFPLVLQRFPRFPDFHLSTFGQEQRITLDMDDDYDQGLRTSEYRNDSGSINDHNGAL